MPTPKATSKSYLNRVKRVAALKKYQSRLAVIAESKDSELGRIIVEHLRDLQDASQRRIMSCLADDSLPPPEAVAKLKHLYGNWETSQAIIDQFIDADDHKSAAEAEIVRLNEEIAGIRDQQEEVVPQ